MTERSDKLNTKERLKIFSLLLVVTATVLFVECDVYFPNNIKVVEGENFDVPKGFAYTLETLSSDFEHYGDYNAQVKLFGLVPVKEVTVNIVPQMKIVPGGKAVGIKMFTKGLMCVGTEKIKGVDGIVTDTGKALDIKNSDMIISANNEELHTVEQFAEIVEKSQGSPITLKVLRNNKEELKIATPVKTQDGYKLGLWVRDSTAGIGTVTFIDKESKTFGALGHPITDVDTGALMPVDKGSISNAEIIGVKEGTKGEPGELYGIFDSAGKECGVISKNTNQGIYGEVLPGHNIAQENQEALVASKSEVKTGKAEIYANIDGNKIEKFEIEIKKIMKYAPDDKNMIVKITDKRLLSVTGGIVQGMSGSPILQNGKIVGAITHVFVNDPTRGYGIFIENMLKEAEKIK